MLARGITGSARAGHLECELEPLSSYRLACVEPERRHSSARLLIERKRLVPRENHRDVPLRGATLVTRAHFGTFTQPSRSRAKIASTSEGTNSKRRPEGALITVILAMLPLSSRKIGGGACSNSPPRDAAKHGKCRRHHPPPRARKEQRRGAEETVSYHAGTQSSTGRLQCQVSSRDPLRDPSCRHADDPPQE